MQVFDPLESSGGDKYDRTEEGYKTIWTVSRVKRN